MTAQRPEPLVAGSAAPDAAHLPVMDKTQRLIDLGAPRSSASFDDAFHAAKNLFDTFDADVISITIDGTPVSITVHSTAFDAFERFTVDRSAYQHLETSTSESAARTNPFADPTDLGSVDLPEGYRWASEDEMERPDAIVVSRTCDRNGIPYTQDEADVAVPYTDAEAAQAPYAEVAETS